MSRNLRNSDEFLAENRTWDWTFCNDAFPAMASGAKITIGDIDGMVEISGHILFIEVKGAGSQPPKGQRMAYEVLAMTSPYITVVYLYGHYPDDVVEWEILKRNGDKLEVTKRTGNSKRFMHFLAGWYKFARKNPKRRR